MFKKISLIGFSFFFSLTLVGCSDDSEYISEIESLKEENEELKKNIEKSSQEMESLQKVNKVLHQNKSKRYFYTDEKINPFSGEKFMIRKNKEGECNPRNEDIFCDLVKETKDGNIEVLFDFFVEIFEFDSPTTFLSLSEGGKFEGIHGECFEDTLSSSIYRQNIETKEGAFVIRTEQEMCREKPYLDYLFIEIEKKGVFIIKSTDMIPVYNLRKKDTGIFYEKYTMIGEKALSDGIQKISFKNNGVPYEIKFDIKENYKNISKIKIEINNINYIFDFDTEKFIQQK